MANPQLENGHLRIAHEVWEHLMRSGFTGSELSLVMAVIRQTWGWKRKGYEISLEEFQSLTALPKRTAADALKVLVAKNVLIHSKGGGRGVKSKWSFNKDWETWITVQSTAQNRNSNTVRPTAEKNALAEPSEKNCAGKNSVLNRTQTVQSTAQFNAENRTVSGCNLLPGMEQQPAKEIFKERKANQGSSNPARKDEAADLFARMFEEKTGTPYQSSQADFTHLAALRRLLECKPKQSPPDWEPACINYLASPMSSYTLAYMVSGNRYATFRQSALNQFNKPVNSANGQDAQQGLSLEERNRRTVEEATKELANGR